MEFIAAITIGMRNAAANGFYPTLKKYNKEKSASKNNCISI